MFKKILKQMLMEAPVAVTVVFADGDSIEGKPGTPSEATVTFKTKRAERKTLLWQDVGFAESYFDKEIDIDGSLLVALMIGQGGSRKSMPNNPLLSIRNRWHEFVFSNRSIAQAKKNALFHYNRGTEMFRQYLDPSMTYTCAYWKEGVENVGQAQEAKNAHVLKKLRLEPGISLVDIGGGWGPLLMMAAERYGVTGVNVSPTPDQNQAFMTEVKRRGLEDKLSYQECDFREATGVYDRYVSLGVYEHAGRDQLEPWIQKMAEQTKDGGIGLLHFIGTINGGIDRTGLFIRKHIFPGGYLPGLAETIQLMAKHNLEVLDIENLRRHYFHTLKAWAEAFDENWKKIHTLDPERYNERFRRIWRFYLYGCANVFTVDVPLSQSEVGLFQIVFSKGRTESYPMTREFLYKE